MEAKCGTPEALGRRVAALEEEARQLRAQLTVLRDALASGVLRFPVQRGTVTKGILDHLTKRHGGNVHTLGVVVISRSSTWSSDFDSPKAVEYHVDPDTKAEFATKTWQDGWINFDFKDRGVLVTAYSLRSRTQSGTHDLGDLKTWKIEVRDAESGSWQVIDRRDVPDFRSRSTICTFDMSQPRIATQIRLTCLRPTYGQDWFCFSAIEFFGLLIDPTCIFSSFSIPELLSAATGSAAEPGIRSWLFSHGDD
jgi:hypothetical protein